MEFIKADKVRFAYEPAEGELPREVLHGVSLEIKKGEFVALLGHNGCGKSTMAKLFNGMLLPTEGKVTVEGMDTADEETIYEVRRRVGTKTIYIHYVGPVIGNHTGCGVVSLFFVGRER